MKWLVIILLWLGWTVPAMACENNGFQLTAEKLSSVEMFASLDPIVISKPFELELTVCSNSPTKIKQLKIDAWMPMHKHGMNYTPSIKQNANGRFTVSNMVFHMPGLWQLRVSLGSHKQRENYLLDIHVK